MIFIGAQQAGQSCAVPASGRLREEEGGGGLVLEGFIGERRVRADVVVVGDMLHLFGSEGGFAVQLPKPSFVELREKERPDGALSPTYPSLVVKVTSTHSSKLAYI